MSIATILTFFAISIFMVLAGLYIFLIIYNRRTRVATGRFIRQASELKPTVFQNIKLSYQTTSGLRSRISPGNYCDLYLFGNSLAIVRRQKFMFKVFFVPVLLTSDIGKTKNVFDYLKAYKPERITFKQIVKGEVDIKLVDPIYKHYRTDLTLKGLTSEQVRQLERIKSWANNQGNNTSSQ